MEIQQRILHFERQKRQTKRRCLAWILLSNNTGCDINYNPIEFRNGKWWSFRWRQECVQWRNIISPLKLYGFNIQILRTSSRANKNLFMATREWMLYLLANARMPHFIPNISFGKTKKNAQKSKQWACQHRFIYCWCDIKTAWKLSYSLTTSRLNNKCKSDFMQHTINATYYEWRIRNEDELFKLIQLK